MAGLCHSDSECIELSDVRHTSIEAFMMIVKGIDDPVKIAKKMLDLLEENEDDITTYECIFKRAEDISLG